MTEDEYVNLANCVKLREVLKLIRDVVPIESSGINIELLEIVVMYIHELQEEASKSYEVTESVEDA